MYVSLDLEIKNSSEIFYCVRHSTDVRYFCNYQVPSSAQDTTYSLHTYIAFKTAIPHQRYCVLSKEFYPTQYLRPSCLSMTSNSVTFYAVFFACSIKKNRMRVQPISCRKFSKQRFQKEESSSNETKNIALSSGVHNVFDVWCRNYHLLAIHLPRIKNTCTMTGKWVVKRKLRSEKSLAQMKERENANQRFHRADSRIRLQ